ncbi:MAG: hypothetical protein P0Y62_05110 [Candidatus Chryseobacterium colombiense]|nr:hypothetical protein [Chryseobacterium sp.]WEK70935.1 MAG: hypothetical protein P0Y62_05110 [Chryseobacterium sp.]
MNTIFHSVNIIIHIIAGSIALILGFIILFKPKGTVWHKKAGKIFTFAMIFVIITGILGVVIFKRNLFLLVITLLAGYNTYSGFRIVKEKSNVFYWKDVLVMIISVLTTLFFLYYLQSVGFYWNSVVIYSAVGYLFMVIGYDIFRYYIPQSKYGKLWLYEHLAKMMSALGGLFSAFVGTILPDYKPYSQILPSLLMTLLIVFFIIKTGVDNRGKIRNSK